MTPTKELTSVLLVDDNPLILDLMRRGLESQSSIATCQDSTDAVLQCIGRPPDLVICDYGMAEIDGNQLVENLKDSPETKSVRVILIAAKSDIDEKLRPLADAVEDFVVKPFFANELASKTKKILESIYWEKKQQQAPQ